MRQLVLLFIVLLAGFLGSWTYKVKTPINRPDEYVEGYDPDAGAWWNTAKVEADENWRLDPEIPLNYIPVPGENELYMVIDNNGNIIGYRKRTKQIDGSWLWEDINPDIPDNYEPVEGLEDVYKVTMEDGTVKYYKYIRNSDDTYAFVEVDENGTQLNKNRDATKIDGKHVHITGNVYELLDDHGVVIGYDKRIDNGDGSFSWMETNLPELADLSTMENNLSLPDSTSSGGLTAPSLDTSAIDQAAQAMADANAAAGAGGDSSFNVDININGAGNAGAFNNGIQVINNSDGTHTETQIVKETRNIDGMMSTYETYVKKTYDDAGNLIKTESDGPYEVTTTQNLTSNTGPLTGGNSNTEETLSGETSRVSGSYSYNDSVANDVAAKLNAQRSANGLTTLQITEQAMQVAKLRAADMAANDTATTPLPTYGGLSAMLTNYGISASDPKENLWKTTEMTAEDIHTRFQAVDESRNARMSTTGTQYGIGICVSNSYMYICEVIY